MRTMRLMTVLALTALVSGSMQAAMQYATGSFTWDNGATPWASSTLGPYTATWINGNSAVFETAGGTVSIGAGGVTASNLTFNATGFAIQNNTLTLNTPSTISLGAGLNATISSIIAGSAALTKSGAGTLTLSGTAGANTFSNLTVSAGQLVVNGSSVTASNLVFGGTGTTTVITNGGQFVGQTGLASIGYGTGSGNTVTVTDPGSKWDVNGKEIRLSDTAANNGNVLTISSGGVVTNAGVISVGYYGGAVGDSLVITNGGKLYKSSGNLNLYYFSGPTASISNTVTVTGSKSLLNNGGGAINIGLNGGSGHVLTVSSGGVATNVGAITIGSWSARGSGMVITNGGQVFSTGTLQFGLNGVNSNNFVTVSGTGSSWNLGGAAILLTTGSAGDMVTVSSGGVVTNVALVDLGRWGASGNGIVITNGGQLYSRGTFGLGAYTQGSTAGSSNFVTVTGANSLWNLGGQELDVGQYPNATGNVVTVSSGGVVTNVGLIKLGAVNAFSGSPTGGVANAMVITNGGQVFSGNNATIGTATNANGNYVTIGGPNGITNATWHLGNNTLTIGGNVAAMNNYLTVTSGGVLTNGNVALGGVGSSLNLAGGDVYANSGINLSVASAQTVFTSGGTLHAKASGNILYGLGTNYFNGAGGVIDTAGFSVTNPVANAGSGGFMKSGAGTLTLTGTNTYSGATVVSNGVLRLTHNQALSSATDVYIAANAGAKVQLDSGTTTIHRLYVDGVLQTINKPVSKIQLPTALDGSGYFLPTDGAPPKGTLIRIF